MVVIGESRCIHQTWLLSGNVVVFDKFVVVGKKWWYYCKSGCTRAKVVVFGQKWLYSGKVFVFGQSGCIREKDVELVQKWLYSNKSVCIR